MIKYKSCLEVSMDCIYNAFNAGFSDYIIKLQMPKDIFEKRFFGPEGNSLEHSFVALDDEKPIGLVLRGIKEYEGVRTLRCGTLALDKDYRGKAISHKLMELHKKEGKRMRCKQLFLEVIKGNDRAIKFYEKLGYEKIYDLNYFSLNNLDKLKKKLEIPIKIKNIGVEELKSVRERVSDVHVPWQSDIEYIEKSIGQLSLGAYIKDKLLAVISINISTRISFIWVENSLRHRGVASKLIFDSAKILELSKLSIGIPNNSSIYGYINHMGFSRDNISQYEMYYTL